MPVVCLLPNAPQPTAIVEFGCSAITLIGVSVLIGAVVLLYNLKNFTVALTLLRTMSLIVPAEAFTAVALTDAAEIR